MFNLLPPALCRWCCLLPHFSLTTSSQGYSPHGQAPWEASLPPAGSLFSWYMFFVDSPTLSAVNLGSFQLFAILQNTQIKLRLKYVSCSGLIFPLARSKIIRSKVKNRGS